MPSSERVDDRGAEEVETTAGLCDQRALHLRILIDSGQRFNQGGTDEFRGFRLQRAEQGRGELRIRMLLEPLEHALAQPIVLVADQTLREVGSPFVVERRQDDEGAVSHVFIGMATHRID